MRGKRSKSAFPIYFRTLLFSYDSLEWMAPRVRSINALPTVTSKYFRPDSVITILWLFVPHIVHFIAVFLFYLFIYSPMENLDTAAFETQMHLQRILSLVDPLWPCRPLEGKYTDFELVLQPIYPLLVAVQVLCKKFLWMWKCFYIFLIIADSGELQIRVFWIKLIDLKHKGFFCARFFKNL